MFLRSCFCHVPTFRIAVQLVRWVAVSLMVQRSTFVPDMTIITHVTIAFDCLVGGFELLKQNSTLTLVNFLNSMMGAAFNGPSQMQLSARIALSAKGKSDLFFLVVRWHLVTVQFVLTMVVRLNLIEGVERLWPQTTWRAREGGCHSAKALYHVNPL